tara:strand:- start:1001 stop:1522 length:522 start_codon:yes stop_codon:yes gene_type:complete
MAAGATKTIDLLVKHGLDISYTDADIEEAGKVTLAFAENPRAASAALTDRRITNMTPAALRAIDQQLKKFSHNIVESAEQVRTFVTNRLIEESDNPDPRIRIKALELLGKISDVGLFAEKSEITVTHKSSDDIRDALRAKLSKLVNPIEDAEIIEARPLTAEVLDSAWDDDDE